MFQRKSIAWGLALSLVLVIVGAKVFARSDQAIRLVTQKLESKIGSPVRIGGLDVGFTGSFVRDLKIFEFGDDPEIATPMLAVEEATLGQTPVATAFGLDPSTIYLKKARVTLRFNKTGDLISNLPASESSGGKLPNIQIESATLVFRQEGHPESVFTDINLSLNADAGYPVAVGSSNDPKWGKCSFEGSINPAENLARFVLNAPEPRDITPELLEQTPFVNPNAWKAVRLAGSSGVHLDLKVDLTTEKLTYRLTMQPTKTSIGIPRIGVNFQDAHGELVAEATGLKLNNVRAKVAGGDAIVNSVMEFGDPAFDQLDFDAMLSNVDVKQLPASWDLPGEIEGRIKGKVKFGITIYTAGGVKTDGSGDGLIEDVNIRGLRVDPIQLTLKPSVRGGFQFFSKPITKPDPIILANGQQLQPTPSPAKKDLPEANPPKKNPVDPRKPGLISLILRTAADILNSKNAPKEERDFLHLNVSLTDVNAGEVIKSLRLPMPIRLDGKVTVKIQADIPTDEPNDLSQYRITGTLSSPKLTIEDLTLEQAKMKLQLKGGKLAIQELTAKLPGQDARSPAGLITGGGEMSVEKDYRFKATIKLDQVALERLDDLRDLIPVGVQLSGTASAEAKAEGTLSPLKITAGGTGKINVLKIGPILVGDITSNWSADENHIRFTDVYAKLFKGELSGNLGVPFRPEIGTDGQLKLSKIDIGELSRSLPLGGSLTMEGSADGALSLVVPPTKPGGQRSATTEIELRAPKLKLQNFPAEKIKVDARYNAGVVRYRLAGDALGGQFEVEGQYPPPPPMKKQFPPAPKKLDLKLPDELPLGKIRLKGVQLSKILVSAGMQNTLGPLDADIDAVFPLEIDAIDRLVGNGTLRATRIRWGSSSIALLGEGTIRLTPAEVLIENFSMPVGDGLARVSATFDRKNIDRSRGTLTLSNFPTDALFFPFPGVAKWIKGRVNGTLVTSLGREWRGSGVLIASQGSIYKIPIQEIRFPLDWVAVPGAQRAEIHIRELVGSVARGRLTGRAEVNFFPQADPKLAGELKFSNVNVSSVFQSTRGIIGSTPVNGVFSFSADRLRTTDDIKANVLAKTGEATPFGLPVLSQATPLLGLGPGANPPISSGEMKATLANSIWNIERLALTGPSLDVFAEGSITTGGRLNLAVAGTPGRIDLSAGMLTRVSTLATQLASQPLNPAGMQQVLGLIGNFVVYLEVTGTVEEPKFRVQTVKTISDAAIRFLLLRYVPH